MCAQLVMCTYKSKIIFRRRPHRPGPQQQAQPSSSDALQAERCHHAAQSAARLPLNDRRGSRRSASTTTADLPARRRRPRQQQLLHRRTPPKAPRSAATTTPPPRLNQMEFHPYFFYRASTLSPQNDDS